MIIQDHTENRTQNRHLRNLTSIVRCHASRTDYFSTVFPFSNEYIISCTKISVNNWKFYFVFTLSSHIQPTLITYEFCWIYSTIVPASFSFLRMKIVCLFFSSFFLFFSQSFVGMAAHNKSVPKSKNCRESRRFFRKFPKFFYKL
jgi:hypothetical protein